MQTLLVATTNAGKLAEFEGALRELPVELISLRDLDPFPEILEDGKSFEENALKKARTMAEFSGLVTLADDSGLEVVALGGEPGIHSARYAGPEGNDEKNNDLVLNRLNDVEQSNRGARFICVLTLSEPLALGGQHWFFRGECEGWITFAPQGKHGFGYDPLFFYPQLGRTFAEMDRQKKDQVSHRGKALSKLKNKLPALFPLEVKPG